jgi:hypothetical protein
MLLPLYTYILYCVCAKAFASCFMTFYHSIHSYKYNIYTLGKGCEKLSKIDPTTSPGKRFRL